MYRPKNGENGKLGGKGGGGNGGKWEGMANRACNWRGVTAVRGDVKGGGVPLLVSLLPDPSSSVCHPLSPPKNRNRDSCVLCPATSADPLRLNVVSPSLSGAAIVYNATR